MNKVYLRLLYFMLGFLKDMTGNDLESFPIMKKSLFTNELVPLIKAKALGVRKADFFQTPDSNQYV